MKDERRLWNETSVHEGKQHDPCGIKAEGRLLGGGRSVVKEEKGDTVEWGGGQEGSSLILKDRALLCY